MNDLRTKKNFGKSGVVQSCRLYWQKALNVTLHNKCFSYSTHTVCLSPSQFIMSKVVSIQRTNDNGNDCHINVDALKWTQCSLKELKCGKTALNILSGSCSHDSEFEFLFSNTLKYRVHEA